MKVTRALLDASKALTVPANWYGHHYTRTGLVEDVQSRAAELETMREGTELAPFQVAYLQSLRSRLNDPCLASFTVAQAWHDAFSDAYTAGE